MQDLSSPCRSVQLTASLLKVELEIKPVNLLKGEHKKTDFYTNLNPTGQVPILVDGDIVVSESRACILYLIKKYGGLDHSLYPVQTDISLTSKIDQFLFFEMGEIYGKFQKWWYPRCFTGAQNDQGAENDFYKILKIVNDRWVNGVYLVGNSMTAADVALAASMTMFHDVAGVDLAEYPKLESWYSAIKKEWADWDQINASGVALFRSIFDKNNEKPKVALSEQLL